MDITAAITCFLKQRLSVTCMWSQNTEIARKKNHKKKKKSLNDITFYDTVLMWHETDSGKTVAIFCLFVNILISARCFNTLDAMVIFSTLFIT